MKDCCLEAMDVLLELAQLLLEAPPPLQVQVEEAAVVAPNNKNNQMHNRLQRHVHCWRLGKLLFNKETVVSRATCALQLQELVLLLRRLKLQLLQQRSITRTPVVGLVPLFWL